MPSEQTPASQSEFERDEDFLSVYANNVLFEPSVWDLKMIFGQLDQSEGRAVVEQHTAVTIPWAQAKVLSYYLQVNLTAYEIENGRIAIPTGVLPPEPGPIPPELEGNQQAKAIREAAIRLREQFLASL